MDSELYHHGIKGQKWGVRRYRNEDGSLTPKGKQKLKTYKEKETLKSNAKWDKKIRKSTIKTAKYSGKMDSAIAKGNIGKSYKIGEKLNKENLKLAYYKGMKTAENKVIKNMSLKDMKKEKRTVVVALSAIGSVALGTYTNPHGLPYIAPVYVKDIGSVKTKMRVPGYEIEKIRKTAYDS